MVACRARPSPARPRCPVALTWPVLLLVAGAARAADGPLSALELSGYGELRGSTTDAAGTPWTLDERLRPSLALPLGDRVELSGTVEASLQQGRYAPAEAYDLVEAQLAASGLDLETMLETAGCTIPTERSIDEVGDVLGLERLHLDLNLPRVDLRLGRQAVNWGSAQVFNPTDLFSELILAEPWRERQGIDALRATVPLPQDLRVLAVAGVVDAGAAARSLREDTEPALDWRTGARLTWNRWNTDWSLVGGLRPEERRVGIDLRGDHEVGWWLEAAATGLDPKTAWQASAGLDYSFPVREQLVVAVQASYDGTGAAPEDVDYSARGLPIDLSGCEGLPISVSAPDEPRQTLGRWYGLLTTRLSITPEWNVSATALLNLQDHTGLLAPFAQVLLGERFALNGGVQVLVGEEGEFRPPADALSGALIDLSPLVPRWTAQSWVRVSI
jgi:hypothetical protein